LFLASPACAQDDAALQRLTREMIPRVEEAVGLRFRHPPVVAARSREQVRRYIDRKIEVEVPPAELRAIERAYRAFGLVPDTADLRRLMLELYTEQVAGFYDPDSSMLFVLRGADPVQLRLVLAHELVHALQDQYMSLNQILKLRRQNDRQMAGQAVAEGQATLASLEALQPGMQLLGEQIGGMWDTVREAIRTQQSAMPVFASAPRIVQEGLLFPYVAGAEFMFNFARRRSRPDEQPWGERLPVSTEQVLHPSRYLARESPRRVSFARAGADTVVYHDDFGEFETRVVLETWGIGDSDAIAAAGGWNGDRYEVRGSAAGTVVLWATAWDTPQDADEFARTLERGWARRTSGRAGVPYGPPTAQRRWLVERLTIRSIAVVRLVDAPELWAGWSGLPRVLLN
jgi:hypothetical protein